MYGSLSLMSRTLPNIPPNFPHKEKPLHPKNARVVCDEPAVDLALAITVTTGTVVAACTVVAAEAVVTTMAIEAIHTVKACDAKETCCTSKAVDAVSKDLPASRILLVGLPGVYLPGFKIGNLQLFQFFFKITHLSHPPLTCCHAGESYEWSISQGHLLVNCADCSDYSLTTYETASALVTDEDAY